MPTPAAPVQKKKLPLLKLAAIAVVAGIVVVLAISGGDIRGFIAKVADLIARVVAVIQAAGPLAFFSAMAVLPAAGVPSLFFILPAGPAFGDRLGMGTVVLLCLVSVTVNFVLAYLLARRGLRPLLTKLLERLGYEVPVVEEGDTTDLILILRLTPGIPFCVQNYLLGLAEVPFGKYFLLSFLLCMPQNGAFVLFGDALLHGKGKMILYAGGAIVAVAAGTHLLRRHYQRRKALA
ncbi:MAG TPA: VTT domain-containing protein [Opitutaceae bacterium]|nr:VTT domain-containing protein [Opitutaceae bacterium]